MKNMNDKTKKRVILAGGLVISVALIVMIGARFTKAPVNEAINSDQNTEISEVVVENPNGAETNKNVEVKVEPIVVPKETQVDSGADDTRRVLLTTNVVISTFRRALFLKYHDLPTFCQHFADIDSICRHFTLIFWISLQEFDC
jgi:hypothetical protein